MLQSILSIALYLSGNVHHAVHHSESGNHAYLMQNNPPQYFLSKLAADFESSGDICTSQSGDEFGLAVIRNEQELKEVVAVLEKEAQIGSEYWIDGAYDSRTHKFFWSRLANAGGDPVYFEDFVMKLFKTGLPKPGPNTRTMIYLEAPKRVKIMTRDMNDDGTFICAYQP